MLCYNKHNETFATYMAFYISNKEFTKSLVEYITDCKEREDRGEEILVIPDVIARQFLLIAQKLGSRYNFVGYTFNDEMVSSALYACCAKIRKFDITISDNGFAYFTNVCWRAMVDVINAEEKMSYIKAKSFQNIFHENPMADSDLNDTDDDSNSTADNNTFITYFDIDEYERKKDLKRVKDKTKKVKPAENALDV